MPAAARGADRIGGAHIGDDRDLVRDAGAQHRVEAFGQEQIEAGVGSFWRACCASAIVRSARHSTNSRGAPAPRARPRARCDRRNSLAPAPILMVLIAAFDRDWCVGPLTMARIILSSRSGRCLTSMQATPRENLNEAHAYGARVRAGRVGPRPGTRRRRRIFPRARSSSSCRSPPAAPPIRSRASWARSSARRRAGRSSSRTWRARAARRRRTWRVPRPTDTRCS